VTEYETRDLVLLVRQSWPLSTAPSIRFTDEPWHISKQKERSVCRWPTLAFPCLTLLLRLREFLVSILSLDIGYPVWVFVGFVVPTKQIMWWCLRILLHRYGTSANGKSKRARKHLSFQLDSYPGSIPQSPCLFVVWVYITSV